MDKDDEDYETEDYCKDVKSWICHDLALTKNEKQNLLEALYAFGELGLFPDYVDTVSYEQAILIHNIIESIKTEGFPERLRI